jgi:hypothetical protein
MLRPSVVPGVLLIAVNAVLLTTADAAPPAKPRKPPPPSPQKMLMIQLGKVHSDMQKIQADEVATLGKIHAKFAPERARHARRAAELLGELRKLHGEEWAQLKRALDSAKAKAIREKYATEIAEVEKKIVEKSAKIEQLMIKRNQEIIAAEKNWFETMTLLATPEKKLAELNAKEREALYKLFTGEKATAIHDAYGPKIAELEKKLAVMETTVGEANGTRQKARAALRSALNDKVALLDPPVDGLSAQLSGLKAERNAALALASVEENKAVLAEFNPQIEALLARMKPLQEDIALLRQVAANEEAAIDASYWASIAALDPPEENYADQIAALRDEEWEELWALEKSPKAKAIRAEYDSKKKAVLANIEHKEANLAKQNGTFQANINKIIKNSNSSIAALDVGDLKLEFKLMVLQAKEQVELRKAIDPAKAAAVHELFSEKIAEVKKKIIHQDEELGALALKQRGEMNKVIADHETRLAPLRKRAAELMTRLASGK